MHVVEAHGHAAVVAQVHVEEVRVVEEEGDVHAAARTFAVVRLQCSFSDIVRRFDNHNCK